jgi:Cleft lip and palate transmembrane protein 1 (CLPTM1)
MPKKKEVHLKNLIKSGEEDEKAEAEVQVYLTYTMLTQESKTKSIVSYWHSNLTIGIISDNKPIQLTAMPEPMAKRNPSQRKI